MTTLLQTSITYYLPVYITTQALRDLGSERSEERSFACPYTFRWYRGIVCVFAWYELLAVCEN